MIGHESSDIKVIKTYIEGCKLIEGGDVFWNVWREIFVEGHKNGRDEPGKKETILPKLESYTSLTSY